MSFSNDLENKLLDHVFKNTSYAQPTNIYVALCTAAPTDASTGSTITEPSGGAYARTVMNAWNTASGGSTANTNAITFPTATASWGTVTHYAICDASTGGNVLAWGALDTSRLISADDVAEFAAGAITVNLD
jgi:hypothetical protein